MFGWLKKKIMPCDHRYCYADRHCTICGDLADPYAEIEFTPHVMRYGKVVPAHEVNGELVPIVEPPAPKSDPLRCLYCGGTEFYEGPSGGLSTNILCANSDCRHWFNYHQGLLPMDDLHRIEPHKVE